jgi:hypothetical protein
MLFRRRLLLRLTSPGGRRYIIGMVIMKKRGQAAGNYHDQDDRSKLGKTDIRR